LTPSYYKNSILIGAWSTHFANLVAQGNVPVE